MRHIPNLCTRVNVLQVRRALGEWGAIGFTLSAVACLLAWLTSLWSPEPLVSLHFNERRRVLIADGQVTVSELLYYIDDPDGWENNPRMRHVWAAPGIRIRRDRSFDDRIGWAVQCSLLLTFVAFTLIAVFVAWQYRCAKKMLGTIPKLTNQESLISPFDVPD
jgi:hypothetical protein